MKFEVEICRRPRSGQQETQAEPIGTKLTLDASDRQDAVVKAQATLAEGFTTGEVRQTV